MREPINTTATCTTVEMDGFASDPIKWLSKQMHAHKLTYLLAHADDGVIWGRFDGEKLITSHDVAPQHSRPLRKETLLTARIFAPTGELLVWRDEDGAWAARLIAEKILPDATASWDKAFEEQQILLGTKAEHIERDFTLMSEGSQGLFHAVPLRLRWPIDDERRRPLRLVVRHYLQEDEYGFTRVNASRLFDLLELKESNA
jgi:CRISPR-associated protein (TIGR03984 family)